MAKLRSHLWDASGGLVYHWRALCYRRRLWRPLIALVARWLSNWQPSQDELVIIGPSGGYTLDTAFLQRFKRIVILEPDPLARWILRRRFPAIHFAEANLDCFATLEGPALLAHSFPDAAFLFSNVIGQMLERSGGEDWSDALLEAMQHRSWASYHDVMATAVQPSHSGPVAAMREEGLAETLAHFWRGGDLPLHDHGSFGLFAVREYTVWSITPQQHHLLAWSSISV
jgi:hypothetical protein